MRDVFDTANRQNTSIYAVDPRGLAAVEYGINEGVGQTTDRNHLNAIARHAADAGRATPTAARSSIATISRPG